MHLLVPLSCLRDLTHPPLPFTLLYLPFSLRSPLTDCSEEQQLNDCSEEQHRREVWRRTLGGGLTPCDVGVLFFWETITTFS